MTLIEAAKLAKERDGVIADVEEGDGFDDVCLDTVKYVRDQLAASQTIAEAQQQEPVAIDRLYIEALIEGLYQNEDPVSIDAAEEFERLLKTPASPPASKPWVELTDQEIENLWNKYESRFDYYLFSCAIEAKLKEKNA